MKTIPLSKGLVALVDDSDFEFLNQWKWHAMLGRTTWYARRGQWIAGAGRCGRQCLLLHRVIMKAEPDQIIDHRDRNGLNCQRSNLRFADPSENVRNQRLQHRNQTGFKRVWRTKTGRFRANITVKGKTLYLGTFDDPKTAAVAYDEAAIHYFGEFAATNESLHLL